MLLWQVCLTSFLFFLKQTKRNGCKQTTAMSYIIKKLLERILFHCRNPSSMVKISSKDGSQLATSSELNEGNMK